MTASCCFQSSTPGTIGRCLACSFLGNTACLLLVFAVRSVVVLCTIDVHYHFALLCCNGFALHHCSAPLLETELPVVAQAVRELHNVQQSL